MHAYKPVTPIRVILGIVILVLVNLAFPEFTFSCLLPFNIVALVVMLFIALRKGEYK